MVMKSAVNTYKGTGVCEVLAESLGLPYASLEKVLS